MTPFPEVEAPVQPGLPGTPVPLPLADAPGAAASLVAGFPVLLTLLMLGGPAAAQPDAAAPAFGPAPPPSPENQAPLLRLATVEGMAALRVTRAAALPQGLRSSPTIAPGPGQTPADEAEDQPPRTLPSDGALMATALGSAARIPAALESALGAVEPGATPFPSSAAPGTEPPRTEPPSAAPAAAPTGAPAPSAPADISVAAGRWRGSPERSMRPASAQLTDALALAEAPALAMPAAAAPPPASPVEPHVAAPAPDGQSQTSPRPELPPQTGSTGAGRDLSLEPAVALPNAAPGPRHPASLAPRLEEGGASSAEPEARQARREGPARQASDAAPAGVAAALGGELQRSAERAGEAASPRAAAPDPAPAPPEEPPVAAQVVERLRVIHREGRHQISLRLDPPELGALRIDAVLHNRELTLHIRAELAPAREALEQALPWLRESLAAQGIEAARVTVDLGLDSAPRGFSREGSPAFEEAFSSDPTTRAPDSRPPSQRRQAPSATLVDLWV